MNIHLTTDRVTQSQFDAIWNLLPKRLQRLKGNLLISDSVEEIKEFVQYNDPDFWRDAENGRVVGTYFNHRGHDVVLFVSAMKQTDLFLISFAYSLFHELRHAYQSQCLPEIFAYEDEHYVPLGEIDEYANQWLEQDANYAASQLILLNKERFNRLVGNDEWDIRSFEPAPRHPTIIQRENVQIDH